MGHQFHSMHPTRFWSRRWAPPDIGCVRRSLSVRLCLWPPAVGFTRLSCVWPAGVGCAPPVIFQKNKLKTTHSTESHVQSCITNPQHRVARPIRVPLQDPCSIHVQSMFNPCSFACNPCSFAGQGARGGAAGALHLLFMDAHGVHKCCCCCCCCCCAKLSARCVPPPPLSPNTYLACEWLQHHGSLHRQHSSTVHERATTAGITSTSSKRFTPPPGLAPVHPPSLHPIP